MEKKKNYCAYVIGSRKEEARGKTILRFLFGSQRKAYYYETRDEERDLYLLWIETKRWGEMRCYPCVLRKGGETIVFQSNVLKECEENNDRLVEEWERCVDRERVNAVCQVNDLTSKEFQELFSRYRKEDLDRAISRAEQENGLADGTPEALAEEAAPGERETSEA